MNAGTGGEPAVLRVVVVGARGRMGVFVCELLRSTAGFEVAAELDAGDDLGTALAGKAGLLGLDFTVAGLGFEHGRSMLAAGLRPVIGTSGVSEEETAELDREARERGLGGLVVPNFSLGMWLLQRACIDFAGLVPDWRFEILELHHEQKKDAPSGTSVDTAERMARAAGLTREAVPIYSVRSRGLYAHQEVRFGGTAEILRVRHDMSGPEAFGPGILLALEHAARTVGVQRGLGAALAGREPRRP